jgi:hypothetical protein
VASKTSFSLQLHIFNASGHVFRHIQKHHGISQHPKFKCNNQPHSTTTNSGTPLHSPTNAKFVMEETGLAVTGAR